MIMRKIIIAIMAVTLLGFLTPGLPVSAGIKAQVKVEEGSQLVKASKANKAGSQSKKQSTKKRLKKLSQLGIDHPKDYLNYGRDLTLREMGQIIAAWIVDVWVATGQLPGTLTNNSNSWLMLNLNGTCVSGPCDRWQE